MRDYIIDIEVVRGNGVSSVRFRCHAKSVTDAVALAEREPGFIRVIRFIKI